MNARDSTRLVRKYLFKYWGIIILIITAIYIALETTNNTMLLKAQNVCIFIEYVINLPSDYVLI